MQLPKIRWRKPDPLPIEVPATWVFAGVCTVLGLHYVLVLQFYLDCASFSTRVIREGNVHLISPDKLRNKVDGGQKFLEGGAGTPLVIEKDEGRYERVGPVCPTLIDEIKNSRNRSADILLALGFSGSGAVAIGSVVAKKKKPKEEVKK